MELAKSLLPKPKRPKVPKEVRTDPFAGALQLNENPRADDHFSTAVYFQDRQKRWAYKTGKKGHDLLHGLIREATPLLRASLTALEEHDANLVSEGERIYAQKPNLGMNGITWSQENYSHLGLQAEYMRLKSIQRFTEMYSALERAHNCGGLVKLLNQPGRLGSELCVASLGGGPGFELVALRTFAREHLKASVDEKHLELLSLDLCSEWAPCAQQLGLGFATWDVNDGADLLPAAYRARLTVPGGSGCQTQRIDLAIISYVLYHYMSTEEISDWLARKIVDGDLGGVLIISRFEDLTPQINAMERRGVQVIKLMRQPLHSRSRTDHRQLLYLPKDTNPMIELDSKDYITTSFPNVPHEDGKDVRDRSYTGDGTPVIAESGSIAIPAAAAPLPPPARPASMHRESEASSEANLDAIPAELRDCLPSLVPAQRALIVRFFDPMKQSEGSLDQVEIELSKDGDGSRIVLKLNFQSREWRRIRRKKKD